MSQNLDKHNFPHLGAPDPACLSIAPPLLCPHCGCSLRTYAEKLSIALDQAGLLVAVALNLKRAVEELTLEQQEVRP